MPVGTAGWYLLTYGPVQGDPDSQFFDAQGMALVGSRIAMVVDGAGRPGLRLRGRPRADGRGGAAGRTQADLTR